MNICIFSGNLTRDAELKYLPEGTALVKFDLAVNEYYKGNEKTTFIKCNFFGKKAEKYYPYLKKGTRIIVVGKLLENTWTGKDGRVNYSKELTVFDFEFAGCKKQSGQDNQQNQAPSVDIDDENIPF